MAKSKYEYVKEFEKDDKMLQNVFILVRIDGKGFHKFSAAHNFIKPNDERALHLMNKAAQTVMKELHDIVLAFGESDEFSFLFRKSTDLYQRREAKIVTTVVSLFTSAYLYFWSDFFPGSRRPKYPPCFDGRAVLYPSADEVKDYFAWRQADTHINNLYNTSFWALVEQGGLSPKDAEIRLSGTDSKDKNEMLFTEFNINYAKLPAMFRKGSTLLREMVAKPPKTESTKDESPKDETTEAAAQAVDSKEETTSTVLEGDGAASAKQPMDVSQAGNKETLKTPPVRMKKGIVIDFIDIIGEKFWAERGAYILASESRWKKKKTQ
ncbi:tRNA-His guanylyltransferase [Actinomortierella ambigua]|nr:tRNA-His guanylyltransferase [Actinomortierella ambigua]